MARQAAEFVEEAVGVDVVEPGGLHRLRGRVGGAVVGQGSEDAFDAAQFGEGIDEAGAEGVEEAVLVCLWEGRKEEWLAGAHTE